MNINEEIERIVIYQNSMLLIKDRKSEKAIENIIENIKKSYIDNNLSIPLSEVHAICYRSPHNPLKKSIFFKS